MMSIKLEIILTQSYNYFSILKQMYIGIHQIKNKLLIANIILRKIKIEWLGFITTKYFIN